MGAIGMTFNFHQMAILPFRTGILGIPILSYYVQLCMMHFSSTYQKLLDFEIEIDRHKLTRPCMNIVLIKRYLVVGDSMLYVSNRDLLISRNGDLLRLRMTDVPIWKGVKYF